MITELIFFSNESEFRESIESNKKGFYSSKKKTWSDFSKVDITFRLLVAIDPNPLERFVTNERKTDFSFLKFFGVLNSFSPGKNFSNFNYLFLYLFADKIKSLKMFHQIIHGIVTDER